MLRNEDLEQLDKITTSDGLDQKVLRVAQNNAQTNSASGNLWFQHSASFLSGAAAMFIIVLFMRLPPSEDELANSIDFSSVQLITRSSATPVSLPHPSEMSIPELEQAAVALSREKQWEQLEKLSAYIQLRRAKTAND